MLLDLEGKNRDCFFFICKPSFVCVMDYSVYLDHFKDCFEPESRYFYFVVYLGNVHFTYI